jgi:poly-gamma-glutamate synthesis protein (capsule biosynthesis protein)
MHASQKQRLLSMLPLLAVVGLAAGGCGPDVYKPGELPAELYQKKPGQQTIVLVGDIMTWDRTAEYLEEHGAGYPFAATAPLLREADLTVGNLEGPVAEKAELSKSRYPYKVPPWTLTGLKDAGFDLVSLANNHLLDCGSQGLLETIGNLKRTGIRPFGAGCNLAEAEHPAIVDLAGTKVAFLGLVAGETWVSEPSDTADDEVYRNNERLMRKKFGARKSRPGTVVATIDNVPRLVRKADAQADLVVLFLHWGIRYNRPATAFQRAMARAAIDAGADLIVGHHAHFWQPVELMDGVPVVYGIGNFAFGSANTNADEGLLVRATIGQGRFEQVELFPTYIKNRDSAVRYQTKLMRGKSARDLIDRLSGLSRGLGDRLTFSGDRGVIKLTDRDRKQ